MFHVLVLGSQRDLALKGKAIVQDAPVFKSVGTYWNDPAPNGCVHSAGHDRGMVGYGSVHTLSLACLSRRLICVITLYRAATGISECHWAARVGGGGGEAAAFD
jgi:hypothetical protein